MATPPAAYCVLCGRPLEADHGFCPACGTPRWQPPRPRPAPARLDDAAIPPWLHMLPVLYAAGAVFFLVTLAQWAGFLAASAGRAQLLDQARQAGASDPAAVVAVYAVALTALLLAAAAAHGAAFHGLRARRPYGWVAAMVVALFWSVVLVGIPVAAVLLRRGVRAAYGVG